MIAQLSIREGAVKIQAFGDIITAFPRLARNLLLTNPVGLCGFSFGSVKLPPESIRVEGIPDAGEIVLHLAPAWLRVRLHTKGTSSWANPFGQGEVCD
jgi:hypothetical protein